MKESKRFGGRARAAVLALVAAVIAIAPVGVTRPGAAQDGASPEVVIRHNQFAPAALTVHAGTTVTWVNRDDDTHTVTSKANAFGSGGLDPAEVYRFTFTKPGTYTYYCAIHPTMTATVVVQ